MSTDAHAEVIKARLAAATKRDVYDLDEIGRAQRLPAEYVAVQLSRRFSDESLRFDGFRGPVAWRLSTRYVAKSVTNARLLRDRVTGSLEGQTLTVSSSTSTPVTFETGDAFEPDDEGYHTALDDWTYVL